MTRIMPSFDELTRCHSSLADSCPAASRGWAAAWRGRVGVLLAWAVCSGIVPAADTPAANLTAGAGAAGLPASQPPESTTQGWTTARGDWGVLDVRTTYLEAPASLIQGATRPDQIPLWRFPGATEKSIAALFERAGVSAEMRARLLRPDNQRSENGGITLAPAPQDVIDLTIEARSAIYFELGRSPLNAYHQKPLLIPGPLEEWLADSRLSDQQQALFKRLLWRRGRCMAFSDISLLTSQAKAAAEMMVILAAMTRERTLVATVRVEEPQDEAVLAKYWSGGSQNSGVLPFLRSVVQSEAVDRIDVVHLLPAMARNNIYTYPNLMMASAGRLPDCNWTSLNFFSVRPEPYYLDAQASFLELKQNYTEIERPSQLGDLVCFGAPDGRIFHSCVYVADDIVFTKNGSSIFSPWLLMRMGEVASIYEFGEVTQTHFYRKKAPAETP